MPVCQGCGGSYDNSFNFCPQCGRSKPEPEILKIQVNFSSEEKWEICKIRRHFLGGSEDDYVVGYFSAQGVGLNGTFFAGETPIFTHSINGYNGENVAHSFLVNKLVEHGWEATTLVGGAWWELQLRRLAGEDYPKPWEIWHTWFKIPLFGKRYFYAMHDVTRPRANPVEHGRSKGFNVGLSGLVKENDETRNVLNEFIRTLEQEGFEKVKPNEQETLSKCSGESSWFEQFFFKAIYQVSQ